MSAFGGVVVLNRAVGAALGERLAEQFVEVLFAPGYDDGALETLRQKPSTRDPRSTASGAASTPGERDYKRVLGGLLVQDRDADIEDRERWRSSPGGRRRSGWGDLLFAWRVCKHVDVERDRHREGARRRSGSAPGR